jgi:hypothetical protein
MRFSLPLGAGVLLLAAGLGVQGQTAPGGEAPAEMKGLPPRMAPSDYQAHAQVGPVILAAEFKGHAVPTPDGTLETEEYVAVEVAVFGSAGARATISAGDFSLRINGKKNPEPSEPLGRVAGSLKDPEWISPEEEAEKKPSKTALGGSVGGGEQRNPGDPPRVYRVPFNVRREWTQRAQKTPLPEGDRTLPVAGLLFFEYRGKPTSVRSLELIYSGSAGKVTVPLQP